MQTLASEAAIALERTRTSIELAEALERERLLATISRRLRTEFDLDAAVVAAVEETGRALGAARCFIRLEAEDGSLPVAAMWTAPDAKPLGEGTDRLPVSNLAARDQRTFAVADVEERTELADPSLGGLDRLRDLGTRAVLATPIVVQGHTVGVLTAHRDLPRAWSQGDATLIEAVAAEAALTIRLGRLLEEN